jgi:hypothetical protein
MQQNSVIRGILGVDRVLPAKQIGESNVSALGKTVSDLRQASARFSLGGGTVKRTKRHLIAMPSAVLLALSFATLGSAEEETCTQCVSSCTDGLAAACKKCGSGFHADACGAEPSCDTGGQVTCKKHNE